MPSSINSTFAPKNAAKNAGILAAQILGTSDPEILDKMVVYKKEVADAVAVKYKRLEEEGYENYKK